MIKFLLNEFDDEKGKDLLGWFICWILDMFGNLDLYGVVEFFFYFVYFFGFFY